MSKKLDQVVELAAQLAEARIEVARLETELERLLGEGGGAPVADRRQLIAERATGAVGVNTTTRQGHKPKRGELLAQVVDLVKSEGLGAAQIAERLGTTRGNAQAAIHRARKNGLLPKAAGRK